MDVVVVTGVGGMGVACGRRLGSGAHLVFADFDADKLGAVVEEFTVDGFAVTGQHVDVSDRASVDALVDVVRDLGPLRTLVHTAGLSPTQATGARVLEVDMLGTDHVLTAFFDLVVEGTAAVCIASMAGHMATFPPELERALTVAPTDGLMDLLGDIDLDDFGATYSLAKRVNHLRVEQAAVTWGQRGGRVVSISPGIISTPMGRQEIEEGAGEQMQGMLAISPVPRIGTAEDIAAAAQWLASPQASFVSGCDVRVDGGVTAAVRGILAGG
ncbi:MAG TPA: SDR family oxidoreductase [Acidimicrobiia bacterium]|jgi:NAD(P)-dependent dehydrogenase (short-subunit alcohol dehydrogenase family)